MTTDFKEVLISDDDKFAEMLVSGLTIDLLREKLKLRLDEGLKSDHGVADADVQVLEVFVGLPPRVAIVKHRANLFSVEFQILEDDEVRVSMMQKVRQAALEQVTAILERSGVSIGELSPDTEQATETFIL